MVCEQELFGSAGRTQENKRESQEENRSVPYGASVKSSAYYRAMYVRRGTSGRFQDSAGGRMLHMDVMEAQRELARRLGAATVTEAPGEQQEVESG